MAQTSDASLAPPVAAPDPIAMDQAKPEALAGFLPVDISLLAAGRQRTFGLYQRVRNAMVLFCAPGYPLPHKTLSDMLDKDDTTLYVPMEQSAALSAYAESALHDVVQNERVAVQRRSQILYTSARSIMADILANPTSDELVRRTVALAGTTVKFMTETPGALNSMVGLFGKDYYTFTHSVHVCVLGVALYKHMVSPNPEDLRRFGLGALLHDVGKSAIDINILNKPGRLEPHEFEHIKHHPAIGWELVRQHGLDDPIVKQTILLHHEKLDGSGYPYGAGGQGIPVIARLACIVDIYDALTTDRPYRLAMTHADAMTLMKTRMLPAELDASFLSGFETIAERFRGGSLLAR